MPHGPESRRFEALLRQRGIAAMAPELEREILERYQNHYTVLVLDACGFTQVTQEYGIIHYLALVLAMRDMVCPLFTEHGAITHWTMADDIFGVFDTVAQAVACALEIQRNVICANAVRPPISRLDVCIGIGCGRLLRIGKENGWGHEMNLASRLGEDVARQREILLTAAAFRALEPPPANLRFEKDSIRQGNVDIGFHRVRVTG